jgi:hypothetical protein
MTTHVPTHHVGFGAHPALRDTLIVIVTVVIVMAAVFAAGQIFPGLTSSASSMTESERMIDFRAGERALYQAPVVTESERMIEFWAGERADWPTQVPTP